MNYRIFRLPAALCAALLLALGLGGCKENTIISSNVTPAVDNIHTFQVSLSDSFFEAKTVRDDSIVTSSATTSIYQALGWAQDGVANTAASIYLQVVPTTTGTSLPAGQTLDSAVIILPYAGFTWGDTVSTSTYTINAYQIMDTLAVASTYYAFSQKATGNTIVGSGSFRLGPHGTGVITDSVLVNGTNVAPHARIRLNSTIMNTVKAALDTNTTFAGFTSAFNGIYLVPDTSGQGKALPYFLVDGTVGNYTGANLLLYTHNGTQDSVFSLPYNPTYASRFNRITRSYPDQNIFNASNQRLVMENQPGAAIDFNFKNLDKLTQIPANAILNKVEIAFTEVDSDARFFRPARIYPVGISSTGIRYTIADRYPTTSQDGLDFIDGTPRRDNTGTVKYLLNIPRELQAAITTKQTGLHLLIGGTVNYPGAYKLIVGSLFHTNPAYRPTVNIIYSKQN